MNSEKNDLKSAVQLNCQYPGQTMMVSLAIMLNYPTLEDAAKKGITFSSASENSNICGAGCAIQLALKVLSEGVLQDKSSNEMINDCASAWRDYAGGQKYYEKYVAIGIEKAERFIEEFVNSWDIWKAASKKYKYDIDTL